MSRCFVTLVEASRAFGHRNTCPSYTSELARRAVGKLAWAARPEKDLEWGGSERDHATTPGNFCSARHARYRKQTQCP